MLNWDSYYLEPLINSVNIFTNSNQIILKDKLGNVNIILTKTTIEQPISSVSLTGNYTTNIPNDKDIIIRLK